MRHMTWISMLLAWLGCAPPPSDWTSAKELVRQRFPEVRQLSVDELAERLDDGTEPPLIIDVRERAEYEVSHLPGAIWASSEELEDVVRREGADRDVVLYCSIGYRSSMAAKRLQGSGIEGVSNLEGSIFEWANSGRPVERDGEPVREVHPYDEEWGRLLERDLHAYSPGDGSSRP